MTRLTVVDRANAHPRVAWLWSSRCRSFRRHPYSAGHFADILTHPVGHPGIGRWVVEDMHESSSGEFGAQAVYIVPKGLPAEGWCRLTSMLMCEWSYWSCYAGTCVSHSWETRRHSMPFG